MKLSSQEEYGLRCLLQVARSGESLTIAELSRLEGISSPNVAKILRILRRGGAQLVGDATLRAVAVRRARLDEEPGAHEMELQLLVDASARTTRVRPHDRGQNDLALPVPLRDARVDVELDRHAKRGEVLVPVAPRYPRPDRGSEHTKRLRA